MKSTKKELIEACNTAILFCEDCIKSCNACDIQCKEGSSCNLTQDCVVKIENNMEACKNCIDICNSILDQKIVNPDQENAIKKCINQASECIKKCKAATDKIQNESYSDGCNWPIESCNKTIQACDELIEILEK